MGEDLYEDLHAVADPVEFLRRSVATFPHEHIEFSVAEFFSWTCK